MKKFTQAVAVLFTFFLASVSCSNEKKEIAGPAVNEKVTVQEIKAAKKDDAFLANFLKSESFQILESNVTDLNIEDVQTVSFSKSSLKGLIIRIKDENGFKREIMSVYNTENERFATLLRESNVKSKNGVYNGEINWYSADKSKLNEMTITNNKISKYQLYTSGRFDIRNARFASVNSCTWQCTNADFNCEYDQAKSTCESDWQCDFACSFNPCAIAYLASAIIACTVC